MCKRTANLRWDDFKLDWLPKSRRNKTDYSGFMVSHPIMSTLMQKMIIVLIDHSMKIKHVLTQEQKAKIRYLTSSF